jgi:hypothetical protein
VFHRFGHELDDEGQASLLALKRAGIPADLGEVRYGNNLISLEAEEDIAPATSLLKRSSHNCQPK